MAKFQDLYGNMILVTLMILALISLVIITQSGNDAEQPIADDELIGITQSGLDTSLESLEGTSDSKFRTFISEVPVLGFGAIVLFSIVDVGRSFANVIFDVFTLIIQLPLVIIGIEKTIVSTIISFLTISAIIALWVIYKFGG